MILDLASKWEIDIKRSFLLGNAKGDLEAAEASSIPGHIYSGGDVRKFIAQFLDLPKTFTSR